MSRDSLLEIDPPVELKFKGPFTDVSAATLKLSNPTGKPVNFKVKTTAPKQYCVRPNAGSVQPGEAVDVQVMLQPADFDATKAVKHKFMVQAVFAPPDGKESDDLWKSQAVHDTKLRCSFDTSNGASEQTSSSAASSPADSSHSENSKVAESTPPQSEFAVPARALAESSFQPTTPVASSSVEGKKEERSGVIKREKPHQGELQSQVESLERKNKELQSENVTLRSRPMKTQASEQGDVGAGRKVRTASISGGEGALAGLPTPVLVLLALIVGLIIGKLLF